MRTITKILAAAGAALALGAPVAGAAPTQQATLTINAGRSGIEGLNGSGWTTITVKADKASDFGIVALNEGKDTGIFANTIDELAPDQLGSWGKWIVGGSTSPRQPYVTTVNLTPGQYAVVTFGKKSNTWVGGFGVRDVATVAEEPASGATVQLRDFRFVAPKQMTAGAGIKVVNEGRQLHELVLARVKGQPIAQAVKLAKQGKFGKIKLTGMPSQLVGLVSSGTTNIVQPKLTPGQYLLVCAYADKHSRNKPHSMLGMAQAITVR